MDRRKFLTNAGALGAGVLAIPFTAWNDVFKTVPMGLVVHSYAGRWQSKTESEKFPAFTNALDLLEHCSELGAGGLQVVVKDWTPDFAKKMRARKDKLGLYLEGSISIPARSSDLSRFERELLQAKAAGIQVLRTVTSPGRRYEVFRSAKAVQDFKRTSFQSLQLAEPILRKNRMRLAIENHKDWRADELDTLLRQLSSEHIGVTIDFGNSISLLEDPVEVVRTLGPYVFSTHIKDMGVEEYTDGFLLSEVPLGTGILDLSKMIALCRRYNPSVTFNLEMITRDPLEIPCLTEKYWDALSGVAGEDLARTMRTVKEKRFLPALPRVAQLTYEERLAIEEENIVQCFNYSKDKTGLK